MADDFTVAQPDETPVEVKDAPKKRSPKIEVRVLNERAYLSKDCIVVISTQSPLQAWLLPKKDVKPNDEGVFKVSKSVLDAAPQPMDILSTLEDAIPTAEDLQVALWNRGIVEIEDYQDQRKVQKVLTRAFPTAGKLSQLATR